MTKQDYIDMWKHAGLFHNDATEAAAICIQRDNELRQERQSYHLGISHIAAKYDEQLAPYAQKIWQERQKREREQERMALIEGKP